MIFIFFCRLLSFIFRYCNRYIFYRLFEHLEYSYWNNLWSLSAFHLQAQNHVQMDLFYVFKNELVVSVKGYECWTVHVISCTFYMQTKKWWIFDFYTTCCSKISSSSSLSRSHCTETWSCNTNNKLCQQIPNKQIFERILSTQVDNYEHTRNSSFLSSVFTTCHRTYF